MGVMSSIRECRLFHRSAFFCRSLMGMLPWLIFPAAAEENHFTGYLRGDLVNGLPDIVTINGVQTFNDAWGSVEIAGRTGLQGAQFGLWSYKIEYLSPVFLGQHRATFRVVKNDFYSSQGTQQDTRYAQRLTSLYRPFEAIEGLRDSRLAMDLGVAENLAEVSGANVLPAVSGPVTVLPLWALRYTLPDLGGLDYTVSYSNFDVFDPYPASQPYLQLEGSRKVEGIEYFGYLRYRWDYSIDHFYSLYLAVGLTLPD